MPGATLTIAEAAETTGWSQRMLRYVESSGLVVPPRSTGGYRLYGAAELQRLRTLRELVDTHGLGLAEVGFALRLRNDRALADAVDGWLRAEPLRPDDVSPADWLRWEQHKHQRLLAAHAPTTAHHDTTETV
ncbi:MAG TPA: MerR family transcriptional regulator [Miltoncostaeaceae bacterium]|nr:MerR family transcriptional regulator [Miltoncostaeaceae bacterium]